MADDLHVIVHDSAGKTHKIPALTGWRIMEIIRDHSLPIKGECGGALACATCHVLVDQNWVNKIPPPTEEEIRIMDDLLWERHDNSRLSCQILMREDLNGLAVLLPPEA